MTLNFIKHITFLCFLLLTILFFPQKIFAQSNEPPKQEFYKAEVVSIDDSGEKNIEGLKSIYQKLKLKLLDGPDKNSIIQIDSGGQINITEHQKVSVGDKVIIAKIISGENQPVQYFIADKYRLNYLPYLLIFFIFLILLIARKKGLYSIIGLIFSLGIISMWIVPQIINGGDPLLISSIGSFAILFSTTYLAHGISKQTTVALISTFISLIITVLLAIIMVNLTKLAGLGDENAYSLLLGPQTASINLQGLLLGGIIIGTLGALNDITTTQAAAIFEFAKEDPRIKFDKLMSKGFLIGREHIVSLVNTLVLAYAGTSLAIIIFFVLNPSNQPYWVILNSEIIFDEIIRTIAGSTGLILSVPLVTFIASWYVSRKK